MESSQPTKISGVKIAIAAVPALLIVSICVALYLGAQIEQEESRPIEGEVTVPEMVDFLNKLNQMIGERSFSSEEGIRALRQTSAMIQGTLGPENLGYRIFTSQADPAVGLLWETIWIEVGEVDEEDPLIVAIPYGEGGTEVAFGLGVAEYLTSHAPGNPMQLVFYPPLVEGDAAEWVRQRTRKEEAVAGVLFVRSGENTGGWGTIEATGKSVSKVDDLIGRKGWNEQLVRDEELKPQTTILLGEGKGSNKEEHAGDLLRIMPFLKALVEELSL